MLWQHCHAPSHLTLFSSFSMFTGVFLVTPDKCLDGTYKLGPAWLSFDIHFPSLFRSESEMRKGQLSDSKETINFWNSDETIISVTILELIVFYLKIKLILEDFNKNGALGKIKSIIYGEITNFTIISFSLR